jgi:hypothetical protein
MSFCRAPLFEAKNLHLLFPRNRKTNAGPSPQETGLRMTRKPFDPSQRIPRTGRIKCGTESNGGFKNITTSNCVFEACGGLALETVDGALLEDVAVASVTMRDIVNAPILLRLGCRLRGPQGTSVGKLRRVSVSNLVIANAPSRYASLITGIPGYAIEDVKLADIHVLS